MYSELASCRRFGSKHVFSFGSKQRPVVMEAQILARQLSDGVIYWKNAFNGKWKPHGVPWKCADLLLFSHHFDVEKATHWCMKCMRNGTSTINQSPTILSWNPCIQFMQRIFFLEQQTHYVTFFLSPAFQVYRHWCFWHWLRAASIRLPRTCHSGVFYVLGVRVNITCYGRQTTELSNLQPYFTHYPEIPGRHFFCKLECPN